MIHDIFSQKKKKKIHDINFQQLYRNSWESLVLNGAKTLVQNKGVFKTGHQFLLLDLFSYIVLPTLEKRKKEGKRNQLELKLVHLSATKSKGNDVQK